MKKLVEALKNKKNENVKLNEHLAAYSHVLPTLVKQDKSKCSHPPKMLYLLGLSLISPRDVT